MLDPHYFDTLSEQMSKAAADQLSVWPLARTNFRALKKAPVREIRLDGLSVKILNIPSRAISTKAKTDAESLKARPCFLCASNRPAQQRVVPFEGAKGKRYNIQLNPYPIMPNHFVIPAVEHTPQHIWHRYVDMLRLAKRRPGYTILYNGPCCGASAPDHFHFQAVPSGLLPLECSVSRGENLKYVASVRDASLYEYTSYANGIFVIKARTSKSMNKMFYRLLDCADMVPGDSEPRFNLVTFRQEGSYVSVVVMRTSHRSFHYFSEDSLTHLTMSPGCVDMFGYMVTVDRGDFDKMDAALLRSLIDGVTISKEAHVRIVNRLTRRQNTLEIVLGQVPALDFELLSDGAGIRRASLVDGRIEYGGALYDELCFGARTLSSMFAEASFVICGENGTVAYPGALRITVAGTMLRIENVIGVEDCVYAALTTSSECGDGDMKGLAVKLRAAVVSGRGNEVYRGVSLAYSTVARDAVDATWGKVE